MVSRFVYIWEKDQLCPKIFVKTFPFGGVFLHLGKCPCILCIFSVNPWSLAEIPSHPRNAQSLVKRLDAVWVKWYIHRWCEMWKIITISRLLGPFTHRINRGSQHELGLKSHIDKRVIVPFYVTHWPWSYSPIKCSSCIRFLFLWWCSMRHLRIFHLNNSRNHYGGRKLGSD